MTFNQALKMKPSFTTLGIDPLSHNTVEDLVYLARHEIELYLEGEYCDIKSERQLRSVRVFINKITKEVGILKLKQKNIKHN